MPGLRPPNGCVWTAGSARVTPLVQRCRSRRPDPRPPAWPAAGRVGPSEHQSCDRHRVGAARESTPRLAARARLAAGGSLRPPTWWMAGGEHGGEAPRPGVDGASAVGGPGYEAARSLPGALKAAAVRTTRCANSKPAVAVLGGPHGGEPWLGAACADEEEVAVSGEPAGRATWGPRRRQTAALGSGYRSAQERRTGPIGGEAT